MSGGLLAFLGTSASTKQLHPGFASHAGIVSARLAAAGATGPSTVFDGPHGVFDALASGPVDAGRVTRGLGESWETTEIGIKPYPACQLSHATLAAVTEAMDRTGISAADIVAIHARVHPDSASVVCAPGRDLAAPESSYAAKFSLPWSVAALLVDGAVTIETYTEHSLRRPEVSALARAVTWDILEDPRTVAADAPGDVVVTLRDGRVVHGHIDRSPGSSKSQLSREALLAKLAGNLGGPTPRLVDVVEHLADQPDLDSLFHLAAETVSSSIHRTPSATPTEVSR
jgi:2-methylcitrate dehydratase PrpD